jgi:hypothetical protein
MPTSIIETRIAKVWIDKQDIVTIQFIETPDVNEFDIQNLNLVVRNISNDKPILKLIDSRCSWKLSAKAKTKALEEDSLNKTIARAIVIPNTIKSTLFSFMKKFENTNYPQQYFTTTQEAHQWLLTFKK